MTFAGDISGIDNLSDIDAPRLFAEFPAHQQHVQQAPTQEAEASPQSLAFTEAPTQQAEASPQSPAFTDFPAPTQPVRLLTGAHELLASQQTQQASQLSPLQTEFANFLSSSRDTRLAADGSTPSDEVLAKRGKRKADQMIDGGDEGPSPKKRTELKVKPCLLQSRTFDLIGNGIENISVGVEWTNGFPTKILFSKLDTHDNFLLLDTLEWSTLRLYFDVIWAYLEDRQTPTKDVYLSTASVMKFRLIFQEPSIVLINSTGKFIIQKPVFDRLRSTVDSLEECIMETNVNGHDLSLMCYEKNPRAQHTKNFVGYCNYST